MNHSSKISILAAILVAIGFTAIGQTQPLQYFRPNNKDGLNVFEPSKNDTTPFRKLKVRIGGNFTQDFQAIDHSNTALPVFINGVNANQLADLNPGFNLAMANLNIDAQLEDGVRVNLTMYLSARHHEETWVKGGYVQFDKLLFFKSDVIDRIMNSVTIKVGNYELDYGDQHYRRTDGGNAIYNPFVENYIMDEFTTEIGGEVYYHPKSGFIAMLGVTNGAMNPTVVASSQIDSATGKPNKNTPAIHGKLGFDKQLNKDMRFRITGSFYAHKSAYSNTLFSADRTGSHYYFAMENTSATAAGNFRSGRYNPGFSQQVTTFMINPFIKYKGLEFFGTYEMAMGKTITEKKTRNATQFAADLIFRFPAQKENFWVGGRFNSVTATPVAAPNDVTITRIAGSFGWFVTKNIMMKAEYVNQQYNNYAATNILSGGMFSGLMVEASIGF